MPAVPSKRFVLLLGLGLPALALVAGLPPHPRILGVLNNAAHMPVFGCFAIVVYKILENETRWRPFELRALAFIATIAAGGIIELAQLQIGRDGDLRDIWTNALGAVAGLAVIEIHRNRRDLRAWAWLAVALIATAWPIAQAGLGYRERNRQAPALLEITSYFDWFFIWTSGINAESGELAATWRRPGDPRSLRLCIAKNPERVLVLDEPIADWRRYGRIVLDLTNPEPESLRLTLRIHDRGHDNRRNDRFNRRISIPPAARVQVAISLAEVQAAPASRQMDLSRIAGVMIFAGGEPELAGRCFHVTRIVLESLQGELPDLGVTG